jgi:hypothetical protein
MQNFTERSGQRVEQACVGRVIFESVQFHGEIMPRTLTDGQQRTTAVASAPARVRYLVVRQEDAWFIKFEGEEFGPYQSEREAMLFAVDAARLLGEQGERTEVLRLDETGQAAPVWTYGHDRYPP